VNDQETPKIRVTPNLELEPGVYRRVGVREGRAHLIVCSSGEVRYVDSNGQVVPDAPDSLIDDLHQRLGHQTFFKRTGPPPC
jgi:hypothetical protein